jgi:hypothetical protein
VLGSCFPIPTLAGKGLFPFASPPIPQNLGVTFFYSDLPPYPPKISIRERSNTSNLWLGKN